MSLIHHLLEKLHDKDIIVKFYNFKIIRHLIPSLIISHIMTVYSYSSFQPRGIWEEPAIQAYTRYYGLTDYRTGEELNLTVDYGRICPLSLIPEVINCHKIIIQNIECYGQFLFRSDGNATTAFSEIKGYHLRKKGLVAYRRMKLFEKSNDNQLDYDELVIDGKNLKFTNSTDQISFYLNSNSTRISPQFEFRNVKGNWRISGLSKENAIFKVPNIEDLQFAYID